MAIEKQENIPAQYVQRTTWSDASAARPLVARSIAEGGACETSAMVVVVTQRHDGTDAAALRVADFAQAQLRQGGYTPLLVQWCGAGSSGKYRFGNSGFVTFAVPRTAVWTIAGLFDESSGESIAADAARPHYVYEQFNTCVYPSNLRSQLRNTTVWTHIRRAETRTIQIPPGAQVAQFVYGAEVVTAVARFAAGGAQGEIVIPASYHSAWRVMSNAYELVFTSDEESQATNLAVTFSIEG